MHTDKKDKIPLFRSWRGWYWFVILFLVVEIIFFNWLTRSFS